MPGPDRGQALRGRSQRLRVAGSRARAQACDVDADPGAHLQRRPQGFQRSLDGVGIFGEDGEQIQTRRAAKVEDFGSASLDDPHQAELLEPAQGLANHVPVDREDTAQPPLGGKTRARRIAAADDLAGELGEDLVRQRRVLDGPQRHQVKVSAGPTNCHGPDGPPPRRNAVHPALPGSGARLQLALSNLRVHPLKLARNARGR